MASPITTHVLDTSLGEPGRGIDVVLSREGDDSPLAHGRTDTDGRVGDLLPEGELEPGTYTLRFETGSYEVAHRGSAFFPHVEITFEVVNADEHYHIPLLLTPFGYTTYRGS